MATQITGLCDNIIVNTINNQNSVSIHKDQINITLACSPSIVISEGFIESFSDVEQVVVNHFLGKNASVTVMDLTGLEVQVRVIHNNSNQFTASWNGIMSGTISAN